jgi:hypothetical protein
MQHWKKMFGKPLSRQTMVATLKRLIPYFVSNMSHVVRRWNINMVKKLQSVFVHPYGSLATDLGRRLGRTSSYLYGVYMYHFSVNRNTRPSPVPDTTVTLDEMPAGT